jgi:hypothetical protein
MHFDEITRERRVLLQVRAHVCAMLQFIKEVEQGLWSERMERFGKSLQT